MENPLDTARHILARHPGPALPYTELHHLVSLESTGPAPRPDRLLRRVRARTDLFRILDPGRGPWRIVDDRPPGPGVDEVSWLEPWILLASVERGDAERDGSGNRNRVGGEAIRSERRRDRGTSPGPDSSFPLVRESVLKLGRTLDDGSSATLCRWLFIVREERALRARMLAERS